MLESLEVWKLGSLGRTREATLHLCSPNFPCVPIHRYMYAKYGPILYLYDRISMDALTSLFFSPGLQAVGPWF